MEFLFGLLFQAFGERALLSVAKDKRRVDRNSLYGRLAGLVAGIIVIAVFGALIGGVLYISFAR